MNFFKKNIPWWMKIILKLILKRLPFSYSILSNNLKIFKHGEMINPNYAYDVFNFHYNKVKNYIPKRYTMCEIGPGDSISTSVIANKFGASKIYLIDVGDFVKKNLSDYKKLYDLLSEKDIENHGLNSIHDFESLLQKTNSKYLTEGLLSLKSLQSNTIDFFMSQAALEHISLSQFKETQIEIKRLLKPNGIISHKVDLKDHLNNSLNNLRFSENIWESNFMSKSGFYTNRLRYNEMINIFEDSGLKIISTTIQTWDKIPIPRSKLASKFKNLSEDELRISGFHILLKAK